MKKCLTCLLMAATVLLMLCGCSREEENSTVIRMGGVPKVTHVQALVATI